MAGVSHAGDWNAQVYLHEVLGTRAFAREQQGLKGGRVGLGILLLLLVLVVSSTKTNIFYAYPYDI